MPRIIVNLKSDLGQLDGMIVRTQDMRPAWKSIGELMRRSVTKNFRVGGRPEKWKPSKRALGKIKGKKPGMTLVDTARLKKSITYKTGRRLVVIGTNVAYAAAHQFGFSGQVHQTVRAHKRKIKGKDGKPKEIDVRGFERTLNLKIPPRPFLVVQEEDRTRIVKRLRRFIVEGA